MRNFKLPLVAAVSTAMLGAALLTACGPAGDSYSTASSWTTDRPTQACVDNQGRRIQDEQCTNRSLYHGSGYPYWYYLSRGGTVPPYGSVVTGGSRQPIAGTAYTRSAAVESAVVSRGGFGATKASGASTSRGGFGASGGAHGGFGGG